MEKDNTTIYGAAFKEAVEVTEKFQEIDPQIANMYLDTLEVFGDAVKAVYHDKMELSTNDMRLKIFEKIFKIDIETELSKMVTDIVTNGVGTNEDINNVKEVDDELLANIKNNIQKYLKD